MTDKEYFECTIIDDLGHAFYRLADNTVSVDKIIEYKDIYKKYVDYYSSNNSFCGERESLRHNDRDIDILYRRYLAEVASNSLNMKLEDITSKEIEKLILEMEKVSDIIDKSIRKEWWE